MATQAAVTELVARQLADYKDCAADPLEFAWRHVTIETVNGRIFRPKWWPCQEKVMTAIHEDKRVVVLKARRMGLSWLALIYALWVAVFQQGARVLVLCKNEDDATKLLDRIRRMYYRLQEDPASRHLLTGLKEPPGDRKAKDAVTSLEIGASEIRALPAKARSARLETAAVVILDEFAFAGESEEIWRAILPTTEQGDDGDLDFVDDTPPVLDGEGRLIVVSTGNGTTGAGQEFYKQWDRAEGDRSGFRGIFLSWRDRPDRNDEWAAQMREALGDDEKFEVEYPETPEQAFQRPEAKLVFELAHINAAVRLGEQYDALRASGDMPPPMRNAMAAGMDYGDFATVGLAGWELERGGLYVPGTEFTSSRADLDKITEGMLAMMAQFPFWWAAQRYDASFAQSNRTFVANAQKTLGAHNAIKRTGRPNTVPVTFNSAKDVTVRYLRLLLRRTYEGHTERALAISPENVLLIRQMKDYEEDEFGKFVKGDDDAVDALIALSYPIAKQHRAAAEKAAEELDSVPPLTKEQMRNG